MSVAAALRAAGVPAATAVVEAPRAEAAMRGASITTQARARHFLAQVIHESARLRYFEEIASGAAYEGRRDLGNVQRGDGKRFKGRGPIQLTGRANYRAAGRTLGLPLEREPTLAVRHDVGWRIAAWYWDTRGLNPLADRNDLVAITRRINGGTNGLEDRRRVLAAVSRYDCRPQAPDGLDHLTSVERRRCRELDKLRRERRYPHRQAVLVRVLTEQRKAIWRAAQGRGGWSAHQRRDRYESLRARTT